MSATAIFFALAALCMTSCQADINVTDYVYWKKSDINQWHRFFPSRTLEEERLTNKAALATVSELSGSLRDSLSKIVAFQYHEMEIAKQIMAGTDAEGCINGISSYLDQNIDTQIDTYEDCTADVSSKLSRLSYSLDRLNTSYQAAYTRALTGIDVCAKTYPNKDSIDRLKSCVDSMNKNYFVAANSTQNSVFPSPSMTYFQNSVVQCTSDAARNVADKGSQFLKMLVNCAALSGTVDPAAYAEELAQWKGYNDTIADQITRSQTYNYYQVWDVEKKTEDYYYMQKQALEQYVIESRGLDFYLQKIYSYLSSYYNTVTATSLDNPGDFLCSNAAKSALDAVVSAGADQSLACDQVIVSDTKRRLAEVYNNFLILNNLSTSIGNVAILNCVYKGYLYAPNTIWACFKLNFDGFNNDQLDLQNNSTQNIQVLEGYISSFFSNKDLPCGGTSLERLILAADQALYELQCCIYKSSGTTYEVTTPIPYTTTTLSNALA